MRSLQVSDLVPIQISSGLLTNLTHDSPNRQMRTKDRQASKPGGEISSQLALLDNKPWIIDHHDHVRSAFP